MKSNRKSADKMTRAVFRKYPDGQIIALFPDIPWSEDGSVTSYMHVGQHGAAYYKQVIDSTTPASEEDYSALLAELETIGYDNLRIVKRQRSYGTGQRNANPHFGGTFHRLSQFLEASVHG